MTVTVETPPAARSTWTVSAREAGPQQLEPWEAIGKRRGGTVITGKLLRVGDAMLPSIYPLGVYFQGVEDTPRPAGRSGLAPTDRGRPPCSSTSPMTARASHLASSDTSSNASIGRGCRPQSGQRRDRYRPDHLLGIERGPQRHSHHHLLRARSRSGVYPLPPAVPSRQ